MPAAPGGLTWGADAAHTRFFPPPRGTAPADPRDAGVRYVGALAREIERWLLEVPRDEPVGVLFSGGVDSGAVFLVTEHLF